VFREEEDDGEKCDDSADDDGDAVFFVVRALHSSFFSHPPLALAIALALELVKFGQISSASFFKLQASKIVITFH